MADVTKEIALKVVATDATGPALQSLEDKLNAAKKRMVELAAAGKQNTEEFIRLQQEAGEFKRTIEGVEQSVDSVAKSGTQGMQLFGEAVTAVTAGFTIATSVTALYGEENEELQKNIMRVQAAMAILQSVTALVALTNKTSALTTTANRIALSLYDKTVKGTTISLKAFKVALATSGIGLIAVGAALAYENWEKLRQLLGLPPNNSAQIAALEREIALMEARGDMIEDIEAKKIELIRLQAEEVKGQEKANKLNEADIIILQQKQRAKQNLIATQEKAITSSELELELLQAQIVKGKENESEQIKIAKKIYDENENLYKQKVSLAQSQQELDQLAIDEAMRKQQLLANLELQLIEDAKKGNDIVKQINDDFRSSDLDILISDGIYKEQLLEQERVQRIAAAKLALGDTEEFRTMEAEINKRFDNLIVGQKQLTAEQIKKLKQEERDTTIKFASEAFTGVLGFIAATQGQSEADARKAFNLNKAAGIADATVNTFLGASQALRDPKLPTLAKAFAVAGIIASGLTQVRKIAATQFQGGGGGSSAPSPAPGGASMTPPPTFTNPQTTMLGNQGESIPTQGQQTQPMRAYVVERDIQQTTSRVRRLSEFATLG